MRPVDYDRVAAVFDERYARNRYDGTESALLQFTGHWLARIAPQVEVAAGFDLSMNMLERARGVAIQAALVRATAERIPFDAGSFDRAFAINALHHFADPAAFIRECQRVLRVGGKFMTIGLDPNAGRDQWWVHDYFPAALEADRQRYLPAERIRDLLEAAGFIEPQTRVTEHMPAERSFEQAEREGLLDRRSTSQLMVISDEEFAEGMRRLRAEQPVLRADLRLYATSARVGDRHSYIPGAAAVH